MMNHELMDMARELTTRGEAYALVTVVRAVAPTSAYLGAQAIVLADGTLHGWIGGGCARGVVIEAAQGTIASGEPRLVRISNERLVADEDVEQHAMACASNGTIELFIQPSGTRSVLAVLGDTPAADEARFLAARLHIGLTDKSDQASVVLVATQGQGDEEALELALRCSAEHVLMIASHRKAERLREVMRMRGIEESRLASLLAPAGPDVGAKTPAEIALVSMAGVLACLRGRPAARAAGKAEGSASTTRDPRSEKPGTPVAAAAPGTFINPVCGVAVSTTDPKHVENYEGVAYYFCCDGCWTTFRRDPARYAAIHHASTASASA